jgi:hypothetical protein
MAQTLYPLLYNFTVALVILAFQHQARFNAAVQDAI